MTEIFPLKRDFNSLSILDLLEAREQYHVHLTNKENVVATAIGRYRVRNTPDKDTPRMASDIRYIQESEPKTLQNTSIVKWSWPCILIFVNQWLTIDQMKDRPDAAVPRFLYLADGRMVPTCVLLVTKKQEAPPPLTRLNFPNELVGGGFPIVTDVQGQQHISSIGCLVTDGDSTYALTNKHVTGEVINGGTPRDVFTFVNGKRLKIGNTHYKQLGKKPFTDVYKIWSGSRSYSTLDAGLIHIEDISYWTAQVYGIGEIGDIVDLHTGNISLDLIGVPVHAFGCASGEMVGEIQALFYRYKSVGGFDYVSDLLIGPRENAPPLKTQPGDSGTIWFYSQTRSVGNRYNMKESVNVLRPLALQWGGHKFIDSSGIEGESSYALATFLSTICHQLDVDILPSWNIGLSQYWGKLGHYKIAAKASELISNLKLKLLMKNNLDAISFDDKSLTNGELRRIDSDQFVPLADVPDLVWRTSRKKDEANHYANMDEEGKGDFQRKTLFQLTKNPKNVSIPVWNRFHDSINTNFKRGALPFRVGQIYKEMVKFLRRSDITSFLCAAGILAHYVGDACQPFHASYLHHGRNKEEARVHSYYETQMLDRFSTEVMVGVNAKLKRSSKPVFKVRGGLQAAISVINLMRSTAKKLPPLDIITAYNDSDENGHRMKDFFDMVGDNTISCIADGCLQVASIWQSAWHEGNGNKVSNIKLGRIDRDDLKNLYDDKQFLESFRLQDPEFLAAL